MRNTEEQCLDNQRNYCRSIEAKGHGESTGESALWLHFYIRHGLLDLIVPVLHVSLELRSCIWLRSGRDKKKEFGTGGQCIAPIEKRYIVCHDTIPSPSSTSGLLRRYVHQYGKYPVIQRRTHQNGSPYCVDSPNLKDRSRLSYRCETHSAFLSGCLLHDRRFREARRVGRCIVSPDL